MKNEEVLELLEKANKSTNLVDLISVTPNAELMMGFCARVSNPANQLNENVSGLIKYCIANKHWSIFETSHMTVQIKTSRAIAAQILRHVSFKFQEFSQRYAEANQNVTHEARRQDSKNRQNSIDDLPEDTKAWFKDAQKHVWDLSKALYDKALELGIAKEQARFLLPLSTETTLYMSGSVRSWIHYIELRCANGTQKEHMDIAKACKAVFVSEFPETAKALSWT